MPFITIEVPEVWVLSKWAIGDIRLENTEHDSHQVYTFQEDGSVVDSFTGNPVNLGLLLRSLLLEGRAVDLYINHPNEYE